MTREVLTDLVMLLALGGDCLADVAYRGDHPPASLRIG